MNINTLSRMLLGAGLSLMIFALFKDVSVDGYVNLHKLSQQSNQLMLGGFLFVAGIVAMVAARSKGSDEIGQQQTVSPPTRQSPPVRPTQPEFAGELDISSSPYQLFLTRQFSIEKNLTLEKYVIGDDVFDTLEESLREADRRYQAKLSEVKAENEWVRRENAELERKLATRRVQQAEREAAEKAEKERIEKALRPNRELQRKKLIRAGSAIALAAFVIIGCYLIIQSIRAPEIARQEAELALKRGESLSQMYRTNTIFGFALREINYRQLVKHLGSNAFELASPYSVRCFKEGCKSLPGFDIFAPAVIVVTFNYCYGTSKEADGRLLSVTLFYEDWKQVPRDIDSIRSKEPNADIRVTGNHEISIGPSNCSS